MVTTAAAINAAKAHISEVTASQARKLIEAGALVLDVREADEFALGRLPGALRVNGASLPLQAAGIAPNRQQAIVIYCARGNRSALAVHHLAHYGFMNQFMTKY
jgi:rhodanese-related sulfurtransferase